MQIFAMEPKRLRQAWIVMGLSIVIAIWIGSLMPAPPKVPGGDKFHHFAAYAICSFWWCQLFNNWRSRMTCFLAVALMGVLIEFLQGWSGMRHFDRADMIANGLGAVLGGMVAATLPLAALSMRRSN